MTFNMGPANVVLYVKWTPIGVEKVKNGTFNTDITLWTQYFAAGYTAKIDWFSDAGNGSVKMTITTVPAAKLDYGVQFSQGIAYTKGKTCALSFDAYSPEGGRPIKIAQEQGSGDYHAIGGSTLQTRTLTTAKQNFTYSFTCTETNTGGRVTFNCGQNAYDVILDNVSLIEQ
jgi:hypothetical protein